MNFKRLIFFFFLITSKIILSQVAQEIPPPNYIKTIQFEQDDTTLNGIPIMEFGSQFEVNFDDIVGDEAFYYYKIKYYDFDWNPTQLSRNEYLEGIDNVRIQNTENSLNSLQIYTHYRIFFPNQSVTQLKKSGNYTIELYNDDDEIIFIRKFILYERQNINIEVAVQRSRTLKHIHQKQNVQFTINTNDFPIINPNNNLKTLILQNRNLQTSINHLKPQYNFANKYIYRYNEESSFWGGNEYWNFDNKEIRNATLNISHVELKNLYHHHLYTHRPRKEAIYTYNPDINGNFVVRNIAANNNDIESEYVWVHFSLASPTIKNKEIHVYGNFNYYNCNENTLLKYDKQSKIYRGKILLKQGFLNFKFVTKDHNNYIDEGAFAGNFDKTENEYIVLAYYRKPGGRFDRAIGIGSNNSTNITN